MKPEERRAYLVDMVREHGRVSVEMLAEQMLPLIYTLFRMHNLEILHRDIKPANILIEKSTAKYYFVDFGLSCHSFGCRQGQAYTPAYRDPCTTAQVR